MQGVNEILGPLEGHLGEAGNPWSDTGPEAARQGSSGAQSGHLKGVAYGLQIAQELGSAFSTLEKLMT